MSDTATTHEDGGGPDSDRRGPWRTAWVAGGAGAALTAVLAGLDAFWPALTLLAGAVLASGLLLSRRSGAKRYVLAGVVFCLGLAVVIEVGGSSWFGEEYSRIVLPAVAGLGALSGTLVFLKVAGKRVVKRTAALLGADEEYLQQLWDTLAAIGSLLWVVWLLLTFAEKVTRYASVSVGAIGLLALNALGVEQAVTVAGIEFEAVTTLFVGCLLVWFHLLDSLHSSWRTARMTASKVDERTTGEDTAEGT